MLQIDIENVILNKEKVDLAKDKGYYVCQFFSLQRKTVFLIGNI